MLSAVFVEEVREPQEVKHSQDEPYAYHVALCLVEEEIRHPSGYHDNDADDPQHAVDLLDVDLHIDVFYSL